jgi:hypothetical protein
VNGCAAQSWLDSEARPIPRPKDPWNLARTEAVFGDPLPALNWPVPGLELGPGRPCGLWGKPGTGKTLDAQEIGLATAVGGKAFGLFQCARGKVLHISYDFGTRAVRVRYRQLANGNGYNAQDIGDNLHTAVFPSVYLNSGDAEGAFARMCAGYALVIIDCLRDALPGVDENDSTIAAFLKVLARVSEAVGCTFLYLHHTRKGETDDPIDAGRGSGGIPAGSGTIWHLTGTGTEPRKMTHIRVHDDSKGYQPPFSVELQTIGGIEDGFDTGDRQGLKLVARNEQEMAERQLDAQVARNVAASAARVKLVCRFVRERPGLSESQLREVAQRTQLANHARLRAALETAVRDGLVELAQRQGRGGTANVYYPSCPSGENHAE